jgi:hypothetical protein
LSSARWSQTQCLEDRWESSLTVSTEALMRHSPITLLASQDLSQDLSQPAARDTAQGTVSSSPVTRFAVLGRWVPGTLDRVVLERQDVLNSARLDSLEVHSNRVHQLFGRGAMDPLYLTGKSHFDCSFEEWDALNA